MSLTQLNELYMEMEVLIRELSETLINELARRDELEYEKEMKNSFISLLLGVQNKRRQFHVEKKRASKGPAKPQANGMHTCTVVFVMFFLVRLKCGCHICLLGHVCVLPLHAAAARNNRQTENEF